MDLDVGCGRVLTLASVYLISVFYVVIQLLIVQVKKIIQ